jgi:mannose-6-phosphate isomerase-like protein (cupin superfamily)
MSREQLVGRDNGSAATAWQVDIAAKNRVLACVYLEGEVGSGRSDSCTQPVVLGHEVRIFYPRQLERSAMHVNVFEFSELLARSPEKYLEFVRISAFSVGIYVLETGATDPQAPHSEDEVYYVVCGQAKMKTDSEGDLKSFDVSPGTIIFVPARVHHSFYDIRERLAVLVFFGAPVKLPDHTE